MGDRYPVGAARQGRTQYRDQSIDRTPWRHQRRLLQPPLQAITENVIKEVQNVLWAADAREIASALRAGARRLRSTGANHSSMRVDLESGKRTEIDAIVGWLLSSLTRIRRNTAAQRAV